MNNIYTAQGIVRSVLLLLFFIPFLAFGQTTVIDHDFDTDANGWTVGSGWINDASSFTGNSTGHFHTTPFPDYTNDVDFIVSSGTIDLSNYAALTLSTAIRYNTESGFDGFNIEYSADGGTTWTDLGAVGDSPNWYNDSNVDGIDGGAVGWSGDNGAWQTATISLPAALEMNANVRFRFWFGSDSSVNDDGVAFDDFVITGTLLCTAPATTFTVVPDCANGQYSVDVNVTDLGDGTAVDITNTAGAAAITNVGTGTYTVGPLTAGTPVVITVDGANYGGCETVSGTLTEACNCTTNPVATVNTSGLNCALNTYTVEVTITDDGSGDANMTDILINGGTVQTDAITNTLYTFNVPVGMNTVQIQAEGATFITCSADYNVNEVCNGGDVCADAVDITNGSSLGDMTAATVDGGDLVQNFLSCGNGTTMALCGANSGFTGSSYVRTDHTDLWYAVSPNGSDEMTVTISNLTNGNVMVLPYLSSGTCPSTAADNTAMESNIDNFSTSLTNGNCPFFTADGSITFSGNSLTTATVVYLRVMPYAPNGSGATNCETLTYPTFDISASVPQANDVCGDALDIDNLTVAGDLCAAATETENSETGANCAEAAETADLWYEVTMDSGDSDQFLEVDLTFPGATDAVVVELYHNCFTNTFVECATVTSTGANSTVTHKFTNTITAGGFGPTYYVRVTAAAGNAVCNFSIAGNRVAENNDCEVMQNVFPGFSVENTNRDLDFNFATDSGVTPVIAGNDLWYNFDPEQMSDPVTGLNTASTTAEIVIGGLVAGQELTLVLYKGEGVSANNCTNLAGNFLETLTVTANGTYELSCLDELHLATDGGYIVRVIQTAGATIDNGLINVQPQPAGPYNNDCENIWDGTGPTNLGWTDPTPGSSDGINDGGAAVNFNPFVIQEGFSEYISADFENATDCNPATASAVCNGIDQQAIAANEDRDQWFIFQMPGSPSSGTVTLADLQTSTVVDDVTFLYNAGASNEDGILYIYSDCGDANLVDCSGVLDGMPSGAGDDQFNDPQSTWTPTGLTPGQYYLIRAKPHDISSNGVMNEFSYDISYLNGAFRPQNDDPDGAPDLPVDDCTDYNSLLTLSAQGASPTAPVDGAPENDVWFKFTAPNPANGGAYTTSKSWVTVFFEATSGEGLFVELYNTASTQASGEVRQASGTGDQSWASFGNLNPGQEYFIRLYHKETETVNVQYKINITSGAAEEPGFGCGTNAVSNPVACSSGCDDLREQWFKIDLPDGTPANAYWMIEVAGFDEHLDFELRSKYLAGNTAYNGCTGTEGALEGSCADFDHPCSSVALESAVTISSTTDLNSGADLTSGTMACDDGATAATGQGTRRVYFNMNGAVAGQKDYYYLRVFMDPSDPNFATATDIDICQLNFRGPYSTAALADAGGTPDLNCVVACTVSNVAVNTDGICAGDNATFTIDFDVADGSGNYEIYATADNADYGITTGDVLGTLTGAAMTGTGLTITGTVSGPTAPAGTFSIDIRDTGDTGCNGGTPVTVNIPACPCPTATVATTAAVCDAATETGNDEGQEDLDALVTAGDMTGTWTIEAGNIGGTATITGTQAGGDVVFDAGAEDGPFTVRYTVTGTAPCPDATYDVTITRFECGVCAPEVGITRGN